jgi:hypothetical protein
LYLLRSLVIHIENSGPLRYPTSDGLPRFPFHKRTNRLGKMNAWLNPLWLEQLLGLPPLWTDLVMDDHRRDFVYYRKRRYRRWFPTLSSPYTPDSRKNHAKARSL